MTNIFVSYFIFEVFIFLSKANFPTLTLDPSTSYLLSMFFPRYSIVSTLLFSSQTLNVFKAVHSKLKSPPQATSFHFLSSTVIILKCKISICVAYISNSFCYPVQFSSVSLTNFCNMWILTVSNIYWVLSMNKALGEALYINCFIRSSQQPYYHNLHFMDDDS